MCPQSGKAAEKTPAKPCDVEVYEKKIKLLEKQRKDVSLFCWYCSSSFAIGETFSIVFFFWFIFFTLTLVTGTGGEQAVGHSVELHEVTV